MNTQKTLPRMSWTSDTDTCRTLRGMITQYLADVCNVQMSRKQRSGKFQRLSKRDLCCIASAFAFNPFTQKQVIEYFSEAFDIHLMTDEQIIKQAARAGWLQIARWEFARGDEKAMWSDIVFEVMK